MASTSEEIWGAFHARLLRFIRSHVADETTAEDILQDVFLKIHTRLDNERSRDIAARERATKRHQRLVADLRKVIDSEGASPLRS